MASAETNDRLGPQARDRLAVEQDFAGRGLCKARDRPQRGRFAGAVGPQQRDDLALVDRYRYAAQGFDLAIEHDQVVDLEQRHYSVPR
jgi:hypothetical protein